MAFVGVLSRHHRKMQTGACHICTRKFSKTDKSHDWHKKDLMDLNLTVVHVNMGNRSVPFSTSNLDYDNHDVLSPHLLQPSCL